MIKSNVSKEDPVIDQTEENETQLRLNWKLKRDEKTSPVQKNKRYSEHF